MFIKLLIFGVGALVGAFLQDFFFGVVMKGRTKVGIFLDEDASVEKKELLVSIQDKVSEVKELVDKYNTMK